ncbi:MAG: hypothetical protein RMH84_03285 [Sulfolobales archaeon]|nr:hypothetical protein [Sulfolobales archaeon]MCX8209308.1 hypothetical protein [Sulfolobales archaeon]MDW8010601.1 hypothetical protein [Sulfolobales archaeon]
MKLSRVVTLALFAASVAFLAMSVWFAYIERYVPSLLSLTSGLILLSSALGVLREYSESK